MRLLFYISSLGGGGAERVMSILLNSFTALGYDVLVATNTKKTPIAYEIDKRVRVLSLSENTPLPTGRFFNKIYLRLWKFAHYRSLAKQTRPDIVISFGTALNNDVIFSLLFSGIPVICSEHTNVDGSIYKKSTLFYRSICYHFASAITVLTEHDFERWKNRFKRVICMPNPCVFRPQKTDVQRRDVVLAVGRVTQWRIKGFDSLIQAWSRIAKDYPAWSLQIAGAYDGASLLYLQTIAAQNCGERIEFLGFRNDIYTLMEESAVFCLSSRVEGLPMALIEAMNAGCCCIAYDCETGPGEIIQDNVSGLLVRNQDLDDMTKKLSKVMSDISLRQSFSRMAPLSVQKYSVEKVVSKWEDLFNIVLNEK